MLEEQAEQIFEAIDPLAERIRKIGGATLRSIPDISKHQSIADNNGAFASPLDMLRELVATTKRSPRRCERTVRGPPRRRHCQPAGG
jgi:starvation-inducible DNA-binding protein